MTENPTYFSQTHNQPYAVGGQAYNTTQVPYGYYVSTTGQLQQMGAERGNVLSKAEVDKQLMYGSQKQAKDAALMVQQKQAKDEANASAVMTAQSSIPRGTVYINGEAQTSPTLSMTGSYSSSPGTYQYSGLVQLPNGRMVAPAEVRDSSGNVKYVGYTSKWVTDSEGNRALQYTPIGGGQTKIMLADGTIVSFETYQQQTAVTKESKDALTQQAAAEQAAKVQFEQRLQADRKRVEAGLTTEQERYGQLAGVQTGRMPGQLEGTGWKETGYASYIKGTPEQQLTKAGVESKIVKAAPPPTDGVTPTGITEPSGAVTIARVEKGGVQTLYEVRKESGTYVVGKELPSQQIGGPNPYIPKEPGLFAKAMAAREVQRGEEVTTSIGNLRFVPYWEYKAARGEIPSDYSSVLKFAKDITAVPTFAYAKYNVMETGRLIQEAEKYIPAVRKYATPESAERYEQWILQTRADYFKASKEFRESERELTIANAMAVRQLAEQEAARQDSMTERFQVITGGIFRPSEKEVQWLSGPGVIPEGIKGVVVGAATAIPQVIYSGAKYWAAATAVPAIERELPYLVKGKFQEGISAGIETYSKTFVTPTVNFGLGIATLGANVARGAFQAATGDISGVTTGALMFGTGAILFGKELVGTPYKAGVFTGQALAFTTAESAIRVPSAGYSDLAFTAEGKPYLQPSLVTRAGRLITGSNEFYGGEAFPKIISGKVPVGVSAEGITGAIEVGQVSVTSFKPGTVFTGISKVVETKPYVGVSLAKGTAEGGIAESSLGFVMDEAGNRIPISRLTIQSKESLTLPAPRTGAVVTETEYISPKGVIFRTPTSEFKSVSGIPAAEFAPYPVELGPTASRAVGRSRLIGTDVVGEFTTKEYAGEIIAGTKNIYGGLEVMPATFRTSILDLVKAERTVAEGYAAGETPISINGKLIVQGTKGGETLGIRNIEYGTAKEMAGRPARPMVEFKGEGAAEFLNLPPSAPAPITPSMERGIGNVVNDIFKSREASGGEAVKTITQTAEATKAITTTTPGLGLETLKTFKSIPVGETTTTGIGLIGTPALSDMFKKTQLAKAKQTTETQLGAYSFTKALQNTREALITKSSPSQAQVPVQTPRLSFRPSAQPIEIEKPEITQVPGTTLVRAPVQVTIPQLTPITMAGFYPSYPPQLPTTSIPPNPPPITVPPVRPFPFLPSSSIGGGEPISQGITKFAKQKKRYAPSLVSQTFGIRTTAKQAESISEQTGGMVRPLTSKNPLSMFRSKGVGASISKLEQKWPRMKKGKNKLKMEL